MTAAAVDARTMLPPRHRRLKNPLVFS